MENATEPYGNLADLYDAMTDDPSIQAFYGEWRGSLLQAVRKHKVRVRVVVDLACGTGNTAIPWTGRRGWTIVGVDRSRTMLKEARKKSRRVRWYCQDLRDLELRERADIVTCHFDALNHILAPRDLQQVFIRVSRILNEGGLFLFDLNTEHLFRWLSRQEKLSLIGPNYMMARNEYDSRQKTATFHQVWFVPKGRTYEKREVRVQERAHSPAEIRRLLRKAGLRLLKLSTQRRVEGKPIRLLYLVEKPRLKKNR